jgi:hypothetical protein
VPYNFGIEKENCKKFWWMALTYNFLDINYMVIMDILKNQLQSIFIFDVLFLAVQ